MGWRPKTLYHYFNTSKKHKSKNDSDEEWEDWSSEVEDAMDDDDIIGVDECEDDKTSDVIIDIDYNENINASSSKKGEFVVIFVLLGFQHILIKLLQNLVVLIV